MKPAWEGFVDFIAIEFDKYDVWDAFIQPVPVREEMYFKNKLQPEYLKFARASSPQDSCEGGIDDTECTVTGTQTQQQFGPAQPSFGNSDPGTGHQDPGSDPGYGIGGGGLTEEQMECGVEQFLEEDLDALAQAAADMIRDNSDWRRREFGFLIYDGPNGLRLGEIAEGNAIGVKIPLRLREGEVVVGRVHNHPRGGIGAPSDIDINAVRSLVADGHTDGGTFADYLLNYDDRSYNEFDFPEDYDLEEPNTETARDAIGECK